MQDSDDIPLKRELALLLVGAPGSGKTSLALQFPKPAVFDGDRNLQGPIDYLTRKFGKRPKFKYCNPYVKQSIVPGQGQVATGAFERYQIFTQFLKDAVADPEVETIIVDSLTSLKDMVKDDILRQRAQNTSLGTAAKPVLEANRGMTPLMIPEWDTFAFYFRNIVTLMRSSGKTFILTAHYEKVQDEADKLWMEMLALQGQSRHTLSALFTDTWQPYVESSGLGTSQEWKRKIRTMASGATDHKGNKTSLNLPPVFDNDYEIIRPFIEPGSPAAA